MDFSSAPPHSLEEQKDETHLLDSNPKKPPDDSASLSRHEPPEPEAQPNHSQSRFGISIVFMCCSLLVVYFWPSHTPSISKRPRSTSYGALPPNKSSELCPQAFPLLPVQHFELAKKLDSVYTTDGYKLGAYKTLGGAIRIPCGAFPFILVVAIQI